MLVLDHSNQFTSRRRRQQRAPQITVSLLGLFRITKAGLKLMDLQGGDHVQFVYDTVKKIQYVGKDLNNSPGFKIRKTPNSESCLFNCKGLTFKLIDRLDLPLHMNKLKSVRLDIDPESTKTYNGAPIYKILNS